ncbi:RHS repeat-associated core domain-containing protein [Pseudomonas wadenswilerensis]
MPLPHAARTLLLSPDPRQTPLGEWQGGLLGQRVHGPYGHADPARPSLGVIGFNGQPREPHGWYQLGRGHRVYNPALMRFHSPDRLSPFDEGGLNAYAYCQGDPVNFSDPTGRSVFPNIFGFLTPAFYDNPGANLFLTFALLALNVVTAFHATPVGIAAQVAYGAGVGGAIVGMTGASMQIAGEKEAGRWVSIVGTVLSGISVATKVGAALNNVRLNWPQYAADWKNRVRGIFMPWKYQVRAPAPVAVPPPVRSGTSLIAESPPIRGSMTMTSVPPSPSNSAGVVGGPRQVTEAASRVRATSLLDQVSENSFDTTYL